MSDNSENSSLLGQTNSSAQESDVREELIVSAVSFLRDPKVQKSTLNKKVAFLESKGLTAFEIQTALSRSSAKQPAGRENFLDDSLLESNEQHSNFLQTPQIVQESSTWKDYFITSIVFGAVGYSVYGLTQTFIAPLLTWPSDEDLELERKRLDDQFEKAFDAIETVRKETQTVVEAVYSQNTTIEKTLAGLAEAIETLKEQDQTRLVDVDKLWSEMEAVKKMIPEAFNKSRDSQSSLLEDLQNEIRSLKALIGRRAATPSLTASNSLPSSPGSFNPNQSPIDPLHSGNTLYPVHPGALLSTVQARESSVDLSSQPLKPSVPSWQLSMSKSVSPASSAKTNSQTGSSLKDEVSVEAPLSNKVSEEPEEI
ncbi:peroxisomal membrane protein pex14 [Entomophthora muscae]|uniref:Peroxisomal membrane protein pex14 n=1 Tax=Entomophthora muscae TaxID=34485 RepID=A0ACC2SC76_9FUNG|nr:peroxisomal membrane protein pex14 [Entomophthora muscae]